MFKIMTITTLCVLPIFAESALENLKKKVPFVIDVELSHAMMERSIGGSADKVESQVKDVTYATLSATLFPDTYDIEMSYSQSIRQNLDSNLYNPLNNSSNAKHFSISMIPYYHKTYGGLGLFYVESEQNGQYKNKTDSTIRLGHYVVTDGIISFPELAGTDRLKPNQSLQSKEKFSYLGVKYLLPEYEYLPKGANVFYSKMKRDSVYFGTLSRNKSNHLIHVSNDGEMYGFGLQRSLDELPVNKISIHQVQLSKGKFTAFPEIDLSEYTVGVTYKAKNWYLKVDGLIYVAEEFTHQFTNTTLDVPKHTDVMGTLHVGTSF